jgi:cathepsin A (carboxypeptidase C)
MKTALLLLALLAFTSVMAEDPFKGEDYEAGLIELEPGDEMFYWLIKSRNDPAEDPLVLWLTGGPGCSSELALFYENGPWTINDDGSLKTNEYSWNAISNLLYIDQPLGTGFSKTNKPDHYARDEEMVAETFYDFFLLFLEKFPEYKGRPFYITGESYAGHYIPAITAYLVQKSNPEINLISSAIGNGWVDPIAQYPMYAKFSYENELIGAVQHTILQGGYWLCQQIIKTHLWFIALEACQLCTTTILGFPLKPRFNVYDIREPCEHGSLCYDFTNLDTLIAREDVREAIGVGNRGWEQCNQVVHTFMLGDWMNNFEPSVKLALDAGVDILVYSGDKDFICNWRGGEAWTNEIGWSGQEMFRSANYEKWLVDDVPAGEFKQHGNFTFLKVYDAGHMVPMDQPKVALEMLRKFIAKEF